MYVPWGQYISLLAFCIFVFFTLVCFNYCPGKVCPHAILATLTLTFSFFPWGIPSLQLKKYDYLANRQSRYPATRQRQVCVSDLAKHSLSSALRHMIGLREVCDPSWIRVLQKIVSSAVRWVYILGHSNKMVLVHCLRPPLFKEKCPIAKENDTTCRGTKKP